MALIVQKFGGTSVGSIERIQNVATIVEAEKNKRKSNCCGRVGYGENNGSTRLPSRAVNGYTV